GRRGVGRSSFGRRNRSPPPAVRSPPRTIFLAMPSTIVSVPPALSSMRVGWHLAATRRRCASKSTASAWRARANAAKSAGVSGAALAGTCTSTSNLRNSSCTTRVEITAMPPIVTASSATTIRISRTLSDKLVPDAEDGGDAVASELSAHVLDVRVDGAIEPFEVLSDGQAGQLVAAEDAAG